MTMLTTKVGSPSQVRDRIRAALPRQIRPDNLIVKPCDERGRGCAAWSAHHYRIHAFYVNSGKPLDALEEALQAIPRVYETHQVKDGRFGNQRDLRVQVIALMAEPANEARRSD